MNLVGKGLTEEIRLGFLALLLSHARPPQALLEPNFTD